MFRSKVLAVVLALGLSAHFTAGWTLPALAQESTPADACPVTTAEENEDLVRRHAASDWTQASQELLGEFLTDDFVHHGLTSMIGWEGWPAAFPDLAATLEPVIAEGDLVAGRWSATGTHEGEFRDIAPTGNTVEWDGASIYRIECGKIAEIWNQQDYVGLFRQMGVSLGPAPQDIAATPAVTGAATAAPQDAATPAECPTTTAEENEALIQRWYDEVWSQGNYDTIDDMITTSHVHQRVVDKPAIGAAEYEANTRRWRDSFPDLVFTPEQLVAEGDLVAAGWTAMGTHEGDYYSIPATGNAVEWKGITFFRFECGKIAESWTEADTLAFYQQIGVPTGPATPATA